MEFINEYLNPLTMVFCLALGYIVKVAFGGNATVKKLLPAISGVVGMVAACIAAKGVSLATVATGAVSGLAASGCYDMFDNWIHKHGGDGGKDEKDTTDPPADEKTIE